MSSQVSSRLTNSMIGPVRGPVQPHAPRKGGCSYRVCGAAKETRGASLSRSWEKAFEGEGIRSGYSLTLVYKAEKDVGWATFISCSHFGGPCVLKRERGNKEGILS